MSFARGGNQEQKPLFTISARSSNSGILDRLTVETPMATVTADLLALEMRKPPRLSRALGAARSADELGHRRKPAE